MRHEDFTPGSRWRVVRACELHGRRFTHVGFGGGAFSDIKHKLKAGDVITCLGIMRHHKGVPALLWQGEGEDLVVHPSMGEWASCLPLDGYMRKEKA